MSASRRGERDALHRKRCALSAVMAGEDEERPSPRDLLPDDPMEPAAMAREPDLVLGSLDP